MKTFQEVTTRDLKKRLQGEFSQKFSVTQKASSRYIHISWTDGPTQSQAQAFCRQFDDDSGDDITTDYFGGSQYTLCIRHLTKENCWILLNQVDLRQPLPPLAELVKIGAGMLTRRNRHDTLSWNENSIKFGPAYRLDAENIAEALRELGYKAELTENKLTVSN